MFLKKAGFILFFLFLTFFIANSVTFADSKTLNVVMDDNYPPYVFRDNSGKLCGITIDQWALWEKKTGIKVHISAMAWGEALKSMQSGNFDVIDTIFYNPQRAKIYDFTPSYATLDVPIFFNKDMLGIENVSSLQGFKLGVKKGDNAINVLKQSGLKDFVEFDNYEDIVRAAKERKIVVFVADKPPAMYYLYKMGIQDEFRFTAPMYSGEFHRAVKKGNAAILAEVEDGFRKISEDEYRAIDARWMGNSLLSPVVVYRLISVLGAVCLVVLILTFWNRQLKKRVADKTKELTLTVEELNAAYEQLSASDEELRQQFDELTLKDAKINRQNAVLTSLHETALGLDNQRDLKDLLNEILVGAAELVGTSHGCISLMNDKGDLYRAVGIGCYQDRVDEIVSIIDGLNGEVCRTGQIIVLDDYQFWKKRLHTPFHDQMRAMAVVPMLSAGKVKGVFSLVFLEPERKFSQEDVSFVAQFADLASLAVDNSMLIVACKNEIQERSQAEEAAATAKEYLDNIINAVGDPIFVKDRQHHWVMLNDALCNFVGKNRDELLGKSDYDFFPPEEADIFWEKDEFVFTSGMENVNEEQISDANGVTHTIVTKKTLYTDEKGEKFIVATIRDITERKQVEDKLKFISLHDTLTGVYNRTFFEDELLRIKDSDADMSIALIICDINGMKLVNDTLGHTAGDEILKASATIIQSVVPENGVVARIGGDEFAIILPEANEQMTETVCERIKASLDRYNSGANVVELSLSFGYAVQNVKTVNIKELFKEADDYTYRQKMHQSQSVRSNMVQTAMKLLEVRDFITEGHAERLQDLAVGMARKLGLPEKNLPDIRLFAKFHDIGKVGIPDSILLKKGPLTPEEKKEMQRHAEIGCRIAQASTDLAPIAEWILKHQEWWNGQGYPLGLRGEDIPLECRILAIVDAYDAMTSDRPYRKAMSKEAAVEELLRCTGTQFDPNLVETFISMV